MVSPVQLLITRAHMIQSGNGEQPRVDKGVRNVCCLDIASFKNLNQR